MKTLSIPNLQRIRLSKSNPRLLLVNNPHLQMPDFDPDETEETTTEMPPEPSLPPSQKNYTLPGGITRHTPRHRVRPTKHAPRSKKGKEPDEGFWKRLLHYWYIIAIAILLLIILLIVLLVVVIFLVKMKRKGLSMVISPYKLDSSSSTTLKSLVRDVLSLDPFVWCARERELLWNADPQPPAVSTERMQAGDLVDYFQNAKIVPKRETDYDKPLLHRSQQIFPFDSAIIVSDVGPINGKLNTSITYKLMRIKHHYDNLTVYSYEARNVRLHIKRSLRAIFYVRAPTERMWKDCDVPLQIFACCHKKNTILVSNRYKELFSMLHLIFITTVQLKKPVPVNIHPRHVYGVIPELEERMKNAENTPGRQFAERPPTPMCDAFRPMTPEEIKMKNNKLLSSAENIDASSKEAPIKGAKDTFWDAKPSDTNKQEVSLRVSIQLEISHLLDII
ncbi:unnamed protein product [Heligmosomoides polygyrus]|uniref:Uncharacterized protein n=1 Tax=Heligmosomoides polygyrus TaxID=6339 RepID=A0A3P7ZYK9_HELPZ|nr:unnamed protein product [Heligmosomoides polygyrus]